MAARVGTAAPFAQPLRLSTSYACGVAMPTPEALERVLFAAVDTESDSEVIDRRDWLQIRTPSSSRPNHNVVLRARLAPEHVEETVAEVIAEHRARNARVRWVVGPSSSPADLGVTLEAAGLGGMGHTLGMAMLVPNEDRPLGIAGLTLEAMRPSNLATFADVTTRGWERGADFKEAILHISRKALTEAAPTRSWIARLDGNAIATSHLRLLPDMGYFQGCAVLPAYRGRGIYRALLNHRLAELRARGIGIAVVWADAAGSGIACRKLGFETVCTAGFYESPGE